MKRMRHIQEWKSFNEGKYDTFVNKSSENFFGDSAAGVLPICTATGKILIGLRSKYVNEPYTWNGFGGMIDSEDEHADPVKAATRELEEEVGYKGHFEIVPAFVYKSPEGGFVYYNFLGLVDHEFRARLDWETTRTKWVTLDELKKLDKKHFGLISLLDNSMSIIEKYAR